MNIGQRIKQIRKEKGLSVDYIANKPLFCNIIVILLVDTLLNLCKQ